MDFTIPDGFFEEEERDGFLISSEMKHCWAAEMKILSVIDDICRRNNIRYFAYFGTLLGAVRHKGFIPWDDDIDIAFLREDYDRFQQIAEAELPDYLYFRSFRNSDRESIFPEIANGNSYQDLAHIDRKLFCECPYIVGIDLYPIDWLPDNEESKTLQSRLLALALVALEVWQQKDSSEEDRREILDKVYRVMKVRIEQSETTEKDIYELIDSILAMYGPDDGCSRAGAQVIRCIGGASWDFTIPGKSFDRLIYSPFEFIEIPVPVGYDDALRLTYGDYMTPVRGRAAHTYPFYANQKKYMQENGITI